MPILKISEGSIRHAAELISAGELVAFPTETVYGLGGDAFNPSALAKIFEAKGRPRFDPLIVHIADLGALERVADLSSLEGAARRRLSLLAENLWPGPLTLVLRKQNAVPDLATSGLPTIAVRLPAHEDARRLIALSTGAVAAPSANPFGYLSPTNAGHVVQTLGEKIALILDGGQTQVGIESTVFDIQSGLILRPGGTPKEAIEALVGSVETGASSIEQDSPLPSPGLLKSHYAPRSPLVAHDSESMRALPDCAESAFLFFDGASLGAWLDGRLPEECAALAIAALCETGDAAKAAAQLFQTLHELDRLRPKIIHAQLAPERGIGMAINDRLRRGAGNA